MAKPIVGIDPGLQGAFVVWNGEAASFHPMPLKVVGKDKEIDFDQVVHLLRSVGEVEVYLERAMPMAMGSKHAFNYGRGFAALELAIKLVQLPVTYIEPAKWMKALFDGIDTRFKPKQQALIAAERLFPKLFPSIQRSKTGKVHEGYVDALLIAEYGRRQRGHA